MKYIPGWLSCPLLLILWFVPVSSDTIESYIEKIKEKKGTWDIRWEFKRLGPDVVPYALRAIESTDDTDFVIRLLGYLEIVTDECARKQRAGDTDRESYCSGLLPLVDPLISLMLEHRDDGIRSAAADVLKDIRDTCVVKAMLISIHDPSPEVRAKVAASLKNFHLWMVCEALMETAVKDTSRYVRQQAASTLREFSRNSTPDARNEIDVALEKFDALEEPFLAEERKSNPPQFTVWCCGSKPEEWCYEISTEKPIVGSGCTCYSQYGGKLFDGTYSLTECPNKK